jgi:SAM domain (Sterile alpha motif)
MKGIAEWLASLGLSEYAQRFADNAIDLSVIRDLTEQDLKDLGVLLGIAARFCARSRNLRGSLLHRPKHRPNCVTRPSAVTSP